MGLRLAIHRSDPGPSLLRAEPCQPTFFQQWDLPGRSGRRSFSPMAMTERSPICSSPLPSQRADGAITCGGRHSRERPRRRQATLLRRRSFGSAVDRLQRVQRWLGHVRGALELSAQRAAVMLAREIDHRAFLHPVAWFGERDRISSALCRRGGTNFALWIEGEVATRKRAVRALSDVSNTDAKPIGSAGVTDRDRACGRGHSPAIPAAIGLRRRLTHARSRSRDRRRAGPAGNSARP
jgi:hypothetical protein